MARIRTIKPEFWGDEKMAPLDPMTRLVFLGLISMADDAGRIVDNVKSIDGFLFPHTEDSSRESLDTLARVGRISRYKSASGQKIIQVVNWQRHQKVDKPGKYVLPSASGEPRESLDQSSRSDLGPGTNDLGPATPDPLPPTAAARERRNTVLGVQGSELDEARDEVVGKLGGEPLAGPTVDDFLAASPAANRYAWARGLVAMLEPLGGQRVAPDVLLLAMQDFLVADRQQWPFVGRVFRGFIDDAKRPKPDRSTATTKASAVPRNEHWTDKKAREEAEEGERRLARDRFGNVDQRRGQLDGPAWWTRMQREAKALGKNSILYAYDRMHEPAEVAAHA